MARIRSIHPGLFTDEAWVSVTPMARLLIMGLWTEADDQGVFEWKPLRIKMRLFPTDTVDIPALLEELEGANMVLRYDAGGVQLGAVRNFRKFQRPKKPTAIHFITPEISTYVGLPSASSPPLPPQHPTEGGKSPQMEDGGCRYSPIQGDENHSEDDPEENGSGPFRVVA